MKTLANFVSGAVVAAMLLVPVVQADAGRLMNGRAPDTFANTAAASIEGTLIGTHGTLPHLLGRLLAHFVAAQAEAR